MGQAEAKHDSSDSIDNSPAEINNHFDLLAYLEAKTSFKHNFTPRKHSNLHFNDPNIGFVSLDSDGLKVSTDDEENNVDSQSDAESVSPKPRRESILRFQSPFLFQRSTSYDLQFINQNRLPDDLQYELFPQSHKFHTPTESLTSLDIYDPQNHRLEHLEPFIRRRSTSTSSDQNLAHERDATLSHHQNDLGKKNRKEKSENIMTPITEFQVLSIK